MALTEHDLAALTELATRWLTARDWPSLEGFLAPRPVDPALLDTVTTDPVARAQVLADAADFQSTGKPLGFGLALHYAGGTVEAPPGDLLRVRDAQFVAEAADRMAPTADDVQRVRLTFRELRRESGTWRVAALLDDADRARMAHERELLRTMRRG